MSSYVYIWLATLEYNKQLTVKIIALGHRILEMAMSHSIHEKF